MWRQYLLSGKAAGEREVWASTLRFLPPAAQLEENGWMNGSSLMTISVPVYCAVQTFDNAEFSGEQSSGVPPAISLLLKMLRM